ncbi:MAG: multidrug MFS transporter, partial [Brevibacterium sp.]|nr:multidrug MFS transporter [Brevibacterium sp.]MDN6193339.1 multidrug MFS transporter [Brevibacterium sp.]
VYGAISGANMAAGHSELYSLLAGFRGTVGLVVLTSVVGIVLAVFAYRSVRGQRSGDVAATQLTDSHADELPAI